VQVRQTEDARDKLFASGGAVVPWREQKRVKCSAGMAISF